MNLLLLQFVCQFEVIKNPFQLSDLSLFGLIEFGVMADLFQDRLVLMLQGHYLVIKGLGLVLKVIDLFQYLLNLVVVIDVLNDPLLIDQFLVRDDQIFHLGLVVGLDGFQEVLFGQDFQLLEQLLKSLVLLLKLLDLQFELGIVLEIKNPVQIGVVVDLVQNGLAIQILLVLNRKAFGMIFGDSGQ